MRPKPLVTLLTDFGTRDPFVGIMKGVILGICPDASLVDLCHEIPPQDVRGAGFVLQTAVPVFPAGTIHVAVVDPGVGGPRRPILAEIDDGQRGGDVQPISARSEVRPQHQYSAAGCGQGDEGDPRDADSERRTDRSPPG